MELKDFDKFVFSKLAVILLLLMEFMIVNETRRAILSILIGVGIFFLSLKAKKAVEIEKTDEEDKSWMSGFIFGIVIAFVGVCNVVNLIF